MENQVIKVDNEMWESNCQIKPSKKYPIGAVSGKTIGGANPEFMKIRENDCVYIPIFI